MSSSKVLRFHATSNEGSEQPLNAFVQDYGVVISYTGTGASRDAFPNC